MTRGTRGERGAKLGRTLKKGLLYTLFELKIILIHVIKLEYIQMGRSDMVEESSWNQGEVPWSFFAVGLLKQLDKEATPSKVTQATSHAFFPKYFCVVWKLKQDVVGSNSVVWKSLAWGVQVTIRYLHTNVSWHAAPHLSNTNTILGGRWELLGDLYILIITSLGVLFKNYWGFFISWDRQPSLLVPLVMGGQFHL